MNSLIHSCSIITSCLAFILIFKEQISYLEEKLVAHQVTLCKSTSVYIFILTVDKLHCTSQFFKVYPNVSTFCDLISTILLSAGDTDNPWISNTSFCINKYMCNFLNVYTQWLKPGHFKISGMTLFFFLVPISRISPNFQVFMSEFLVHAQKLWPFLKRMTCSIDFVLFFYSSFCPTKENLDFLLLEHDLDLIQE